MHGCLQNFYICEQPMVARMCIRARMCLPKYPPSMRLCPNLWRSVPCAVSAHVWRSVSISSAVQYISKNNGCVVKPDITLPDKILWHAHQKYAVWFAVLVCKLWFVCGCVFVWVLFLNVLACF